MKRLLSVALLTLVAMGCEPNAKTEMKNESGGVNASGEGGGINVQWGSGSVKVGNGGVQVETPGVNVDTKFGDKVKVKTPGTDLDIDLGGKPADQPDQPE